MTSSELEKVIVNLVGDLVPRKTRRRYLRGFDSTLELQQDLGLDSLQLVSLVYSLEKELRADLSAIVRDGRRIRTLGDVRDALKAVPESDRAG